MGQSRIFLERLRQRFSGVLAISEDNEGFDDVGRSWSGTPTMAHLSYRGMLQQNILNLRA